MLNMLRILLCAVKMRRAVKSDVFFKSVRRFSREIAPQAYGASAHGLIKGNRKIVAAGRGRIIQATPIKTEILRLARKKNPTVAYIGAATYESESAYESQAAGFIESGCKVKKVNLTDLAEAKKSQIEIAKTLYDADIIAVSGGNTLFAMSRIRALGLDEVLKKAMDNGTVLCGGSAGAICWFDAGHSDSKDPTTVRHVNPKLTEAQKRNWSYIRVSGLGLVKGLCCPHHDSTQSNGVPRSDDFNGMLLRQKVPEVGVCIDDQAAIVIDGDQFKVVATESAGGSNRVTRKDVMPDGSISERVYLPSSKFYPLKELNR